MERREFAFLIDWMSDIAAPFENREDDRAELAIELRLAKDAAELVHHRAARQLIHAATEHAEIEKRGHRRRPDVPEQYL